MKNKFVLAAMTLSAAAWLVTPASAASFSFSSGNPDGRLGALSRPESAGEVETETPIVFILANSTVIKSATISGLLTSGATPADIGNVEVELTTCSTRTRSIPLREMFHREPTRLRMRKSPRPRATEVQERLVLTQAL